VSIIDDGPYSQVVMKHVYENSIYWTVYEHIRVKVKEIGKKLTVHDTIGFFFNRSELDKYGWQFDHFHFEIIRVEPVVFIPNKKIPAQTLQDLRDHLLYKRGIKHTAGKSSSIPEGVS
jgi:hypothetical protein